MCCSSALNLALLSVWMFQVSKRRPALLGAAAAVLLVSGPMLSRFSYFNGLPAALLLVTCVLAKPALDQDSFQRARSTAAVVVMALATAILLATKFNFGLYAFASAGMAFLAAAALGRPFGRRAFVTYVVASALSVAVVLMVLQGAGILVPFARETLAFCCDRVY